MIKIIINIWPHDYEEFVAYLKLNDIEFIELETSGNLLRFYLNFSNEQLYKSFANACPIFINSGIFMK